VQTLHRRAVRVDRPARDALRQALGAARTCSASVAFAAFDRLDALEAEFLLPTHRSRPMADPADTARAEFNQQFRAALRHILQLHGREREAAKRHAVHDSEHTSHALGIAGDSLDGAIYELSDILYDLVTPK